MLGGRNEHRDHILQVVGPRLCDNAHSTHILIVGNRDDFFATIRTQTSNAM